MGPYPARPRCWIARFTRLLFRSGAAAELGPGAVTLLLYVVSREDAGHYKGPVALYSEDLPDVVGIKPTTIKAVRAAAVKAGWLAYQPGQRGKAPRYHVTVPADLAAEDAPEPAAEPAPQPPAGQAAGDTRAGFRPESRPSSDRVAPALIPPKTLEEKHSPRAPACDPTEPDHAAGLPPTSAAAVEPADLGGGCEVVPVPAVAEFVAAWHAAGLPPTSAAAVRRRWSARVLDDWFREHWRAAVERAGESPRCRGDRGGWRAEAWWFLGEVEVPHRILAGEFDPDGPRTPPARAAPVSRGQAQDDYAMRILFGSKQEAHCDEPPEHCGPPGRPAVAGRR